MGWCLGTGTYRDTEVKSKLQFADIGTLGTSGYILDIESYFNIKSYFNIERVLNCLCHPHAELSELYMTCAHLLPIKLISVKKNYLQQTICISFKLKLA